MFNDDTNINEQISMHVEQPIAEQPVKVKGMFRLQVEASTGEIIGDTGWRENLIVNRGFKDYLTDAIGNDSPKYISHMALGTGAAPGASDTSLSGEPAGHVRAAVTYSNLSSKSAQFTATFSSAASFITATAALSNVGLFNSSSAGVIFSGNTYSSSSIATNVNINCTYTIGFS